MIRYLSIQHLAVIERLEVELEPGLSVVTGETGAGKSVVVEALGLLLGARATAALVRTGEPAAVVQGIFETADGSEIIAKREVSAQGRSRAFLNGDVVSSAALRGATSALLDLHGQHEHQVLLDPGAHLDLLDAYAGLSEPRRRVADIFTTIEALREELARVQALDRDRGARIDLLSFQLAEMDRLAPRAGEDEELAASIRVLANAERLDRLCAEGYDALYDGEAAVIPTLSRVWKQLSDLAAIDPVFAPYVQARDAVHSQLEDVAFFLRSYRRGIDAAPDRLQQLADRLAAIERLKKKHGGTLAAVLRRQQELREELVALEESGERARVIEERLAGARTDYLAAARSLSVGRRAAAGRLSRELEQELRGLAMEHTALDFRFEAELPEARWSTRGIDAAELLISPNPGEELRPLATVASGGELSRIMLALKTRASDDPAGKTLIFDEVDAGIGGRVADIVGQRLQRLGKTFQVLCVTHLPQIAAYGHVHYHVEKTIRGGRTVTTLTRLDREARVSEIARMLGGASISPAVLANARELLATRGGESENNAKGESESGRRAKGRSRG